MSHLYGAVKMFWVYFAFVTVLINAAASQSIGCSYGHAAPTIASTVVPTIAPTIVDGNVVQSLIDTIQLFIVSDLLQETLPEKKVFIPTPVESPVLVDCDDGIIGYEFLYDKECPQFVAGMVPKQKCYCEHIPKCIKKYDCEYAALMPRKCVNYCLNEELILPPYAAELPCGLGYMPGGLPVVAKAFAPCSECGGCGCGCGCSVAALPICSPYSCTALAVPLCPDMSPFVKPMIL